MANGFFFKNQCYMLKQLVRFPKKLQSPVYDNLYGKIEDK